MTKRVQILGQTATELLTFVPRLREVIFDETNKQLVLGDGVTAGTSLPKTARTDLANVTATQFTNLDATSIATADEVLVYDATASGWKALTLDELFKLKLPIRGIMNAHGSVSTGTEDFSFNDGVFHSITVAGAQTWTVSNPIAADDVSMMLIFVENGGSATITLPAAFQWDGNTLPSLQTSGLDILRITSFDGGTSYQVSRIWAEA